MNEKNTLLPVAIPAVILAGLNIYGFFFPGSLNWGFNVLGFLPPYVVGMYIVALMLIFFFYRHPAMTAAISKAAAYAETKPKLFLSLVIALFFIAAFLFKVQAPLLGDSFTFIKNFTDVFTGADQLGIWHEPLAMYFFYHIFNIFQSTTAHDIIQTFFWLDLIMGIGYIIVLFKITRELFEDAGTRLLVFLWVLLLPTTEFFFGYVEIYALTLLCLTVGMYLSILVLKERLSFIVLPPVYMLLLLIHQLNGLLGLALMYITIVQIMKKKWKPVAVGVSIAFVVLLAVLVSVDFTMNRIIEKGPITHFLSFGGDISMVDDYSQAFPVFSFFHGVELVNYLMVMSPFAFVLLTYIVIADFRSFRKSSYLIFFGIISVAYLLLMCVAKIQQGMGNDWDVMGGYFVPVTIFAALWFTQQRGDSGFIKNILTFIVLITGVHSFLWFSINSTIEPKIQRVQSFLDRRMVSHIGHYTISLHLSRYFDYRNDSLRQADIWERYTTFFPGDPRGYRNTLEYLQELKRPEYAREARVYESWTAIDKSNEEIQRKYFDLCSKAGTFYFLKDSAGEALRFFEKAAALNPSSPFALNNYGSALARNGNALRAIEYFLAAIKADSTYSKAYYNLGMAYEDAGEKTKSIEALRHAARLNVREAREYLETLKK